MEKMYGIEQLKLTCTYLCAAFTFFLTTRSMHTWKNKILLIKNFFGAFSNTSSGAKESLELRKRFFRYFYTMPKKMWLAHFYFFRRARARARVTSRKITSHLVILFLWLQVTSDRQIKKGEYKIGCYQQKQQSIYIRILFPTDLKYTCWYSCYYLHII